MFEGDWKAIEVLQWVFLWGLLCLDFRVFGLLCMFPRSRLTPDVIGLLFDGRIEEGRQGLHFMKEAKDYFELRTFFSEKAAKVSRVGLVRPP